MKAFPFGRVRIVAPALLLLSTAAFLSENAVAQTRNTVRQELAPSTTIAIRPGVETPVVIQTAANAVCILHPRGNTDAGHVMNLFADGDGQVRFHVSARPEADQPARMQLDCAAADGRNTTFPVEISASASAPGLSSKPQIATMPKGATLRAGLSEADAKSLSDRELANRRFPPRPSAVTSPAAFATWLGIVSRSSTLMPAGVVARPDISHPQLPISASTANSGNWNGYQLRGTDGDYISVVGEWQVPSVSSWFGVSSYSALWVGLDGWGTNDLVQAGTEQNAFNEVFYTFTSYFAFSELWPNQPYESQLTGLPVSPGEKVWTDVWVGDDNGNADPNGAYQWVYMLNENTNQMVDFTTPLNGLSFGGSEAEWIMERPWVGGEPSSLANYGEVVLDQATAADAAGNSTNYQVFSHYNITMLNAYYSWDDNNTLSTVAQDGSTTMRFTWHNYH
jgi:hypothetical protein